MEDEEDKSPVERAHKRKSKKDAVPESDQERYFISFCVYFCACDNGVLHINVYKLTPDCVYVEN